MIPLGIFSKTFPRPTFEAALDEVKARGLSFIQFNFSSIGMPTLPDAVPPVQLAEMAAALGAREIAVSAISGTFNLIDPDREQRDENLRRLAALAGACEALRSPVITLCTGTMDPDDMWRAHPRNSSPAAWRELVESLSLALWITEPYGVTFGLEPEPGNVMRDAVLARKLLDEMRSSRLKIVFDPANIIDGAPERAMHDALSEAFDLLGSDICLAHGKETGVGERIPGEGGLDWPFYLAQLADSAYRGPLILHGFGEDASNRAIDFVRGLLERSARNVSSSRP